MRKVKISRILEPILKIYQDESENKEWRWSIKVGSNIIAASTEGYVNRVDCVDNVLNVEKRIAELREKGEIS